MTHHTWLSAICPLHVRYTSACIRDESAEILLCLPCFERSMGGGRGGHPRQNNGP